ncbi:MAG: hypothetical protein AAGA93_06550 [Actinomycetota bacterium]
MADTTTRSRERAERRRLGIPDTSPRPVGQGFWIAASVAAAGIAVLAAGDKFDTLGERATAGIEAAELIELADRQSAATASPASPTTIPLDLGTDAVRSSGAVVAVDDLPDHERVGREALARISYPWERLLSEWTIEFQPATDGLYGLTMVPERRIEIYVRADQSPGMVAHVVAHELGHAVDVTLNSGPERRRWSELRGIGSAPWWPESGANDFATGAGDFAESFAAWQVGPAGFRSTLADPPNGAEIELLAELSAG